MCSVDNEHAVDNESSVGKKCDLIWLFIDKGGSSNRPSSATSATSRHDCGRPEERRLENFG